MGMMAGKGEASCKDVLQLDTVGDRNKSVRGRMYKTSRRTKGTAQALKATAIQHNPLPATSQTHVAGVAGGKPQK